MHEENHLIVCNLQWVLSFRQQHSLSWPEKHHILQTINPIHKGKKKRISAAHRELSPLWLRRKIRESTFPAQQAPSRNVASSHTEHSITFLRPASVKTHSTAKARSLALLLLILVTSGELPLMWVRMEAGPTYGFSMRTQIAHLSLS